MKIIHTSDWHLGQNFYRYDREDEHRHFFDQLSDYMATHRPDALVVSGDVFHNAAPSNAAQRLFVRGVIQARDASPDTVIVITAGNHDSGSRLDAERQLWHRLGVHVIGGCVRREDGTFDPEQFVVPISDKGYVVAVPYFHTTNYPMATVDTARDDRQREFFASMLSTVVQHDMPVVMMAHLAVDGCDTRGHEDEPVGGMLKERLSELGEGYDYLALGHIHKPQRITDRALYSGSPVPVSFSEDYPHFVNLVNISAHGETPEVEQLEIDVVRPVKTIPVDGAPLDEALAAFDALDAEDDCYVRLLIDQEDVIPADAEDRARKVAEAKKCKFCEIRRKPRVYRPTDSALPEIMEIEDFTNIAPIEIAKRSYERTNGCPMTPTLIDMMQQAIDLASDL